jgi:hypothetical protein
MPENKPNIDEDNIREGIPYLGDFISVYFIAQGLFEYENLGYELSTLPIADFIRTPAKDNYSHDITYIVSGKISPMFATQLKLQNKYLADRMYLSNIHDIINDIH